jgi:hypothetical protein
VTEVHWSEWRVLKAIFGRLAPAARNSIYKHLKRDGNKPRLEEIKEAVEIAALFAAEYVAAEGDLDARSPAWVETSLGHDLAKGDRDKGFDVYERPAGKGARPYVRVLEIQGIRPRPVEDDEDDDDDYWRTLDNPANAIGAVEDSNPEATETRQGQTRALVTAKLGELAAEYGREKVDAFWLHWANEWSFTEIAAELRIPVSTAKRWCEQIRQRLITDWADGEQPRQAEPYVPPAVIRAPRPYTEDSPGPVTTTRTHKVLVNAR